MEAEDTMPLPELSEIEEVFIARTSASPTGAITPDGERERSVCEILVEKGRFVRLTDGAYSTPELAKTLGLKLADK
ncbi:hypothetical protein PTKU64_55540 [Paraburkholderia terrae]|uniref:Prevent-host-death protein n=2 Tax=Paraburkholderia terrae TaxID=311230 RepID=A0ABM7TTQ3_9BURK|nr:hypothetical protein PTKU64_55540 [Paraburkholderia terrae]